MLSQSILYIRYINTCKVCYSRLNTFSCCTVKSSLFARPVLLHHSAVGTASSCCAPCSAGLTGSVGLTGSAGLTGSVGLTGSAGLTGSVGLTGSAGLTGSGCLHYIRVHVMYTWDQKYNKRWHMYSVQEQHVLNTCYDTLDLSWEIKRGGQEGQWPPQCLDCGALAPPMFGSGGPGLPNNFSKIFNQFSRLGIGAHIPSRRIITHLIIILLLTLVVAHSFCPPPPNL